MSTNLEYREIEIQRKRESRWQTSDAQRVKERQRARARDKIQLRYFLLEEQHENFVAEVRKWEMLAATTVKMSGSEKKLQEQVRHFFIKRLTRNFMEVSRCSRAKQRQKNVPKSARKYKRNVLMPPKHTPWIELIQYGCPIGRKVYSVSVLVPTRSLGPLVSPSGLWPVGAV